jgi:hypothetical protein
MLLSNEADVRWEAGEALLKIETDDAARALQPQLRPEANLLRKLQIRDGYPYAIDHMSEPDPRERGHLGRWPPFRSPAASRSFERCSLPATTSNGTAPLCAAP